MNSEQQNTKARDCFSRKQLATAIAIATTCLASGVMPASVMAESAPAGFAIEEVVVTATRRATSVQDIPYNISAIAGKDIERAGMSDLNDLVRMVPGLVSVDAGADSEVNNNLIMRGLNANNPGVNNVAPNVTEAPVSMYLGDTPLFLNLKLTDVERVEVLRGPQGTMYGSGSVGGTVRFILNKPDLEAASASIATDVGRSAHSGENNYSVDLVGNLPLSDKLAVRVATGYEKKGGVTDANSLAVLDSRGVGVAADPSDIAGSPLALSSKKDTDDREVSYFRGSLLWDVSDDTEALVTYFHQQSESDGMTFKNITDNDTGGDAWEHDRRLLEPGEFSADLISVELSRDLGFASFSSSTAYVETDLDTTLDSSALYERLDQLYGIYAGFPRFTALTDTQAESETLTQEFRLVSNGDSKLDWVVGAYYSDQKSSLLSTDDGTGFEEFLSLMPNGGGGTLQDDWNAFSDRSAPYDNKMFYQDRDLAFEEIALFGELTYHVSDEWQLTVGARQFRQEFEQSQTVAIPFCGGGCSDKGALNGSTSASNDATFNDNIFKFNTSYDLNEKTMVYFTRSEGFRRGGANSFPTSGFAATSPELLTFEPDEATNWEAGIKGTLGDTVNYTLSAYMVEWENIQLDTFVGTLFIPGVINGETAETRGIELEVNARLTENLDILVGLGYTNSEITKDADLEGSSVQDGDPLPGVPEVQASINVNYTQPLGDSALHYNVNGAYRSSSHTAFNDNFSSYAKLDGFALWNASITWDAGQYTVGVYADNITDEEGLGALHIHRQAYNDVGFIGRPRTLGLKLSYSFE